MKKLLFIFGTRPEAIKMAPLIHAFSRERKLFAVSICLTGQHKEMLHSVMEFFELKADYDIELMQPNQTLFDITARALTGIEKVLEQSAPDLVFVQGDTTTAFAGALSAFYKKIKVVHIEAGLRSGNKYAPFPEEMNRKMTGSIADFHFAPTGVARENLFRENITEDVYVTGNTVIDALLWAVEKVRKKEDYANLFSFLDLNRKIILLTGHRRENFGQPFENICEAISRLSKQYPEIQIVYPVHLNPNVQEVVNKRLGNKQHIYLIAPLDYPQLVWLMDRSYFVITDSGGIQEEAPSLGKPVLVMRDVTERMEGVLAGNAKLVGTDTEKIFSAASALLDDRNGYEKMAGIANPYGIGDSSKKIVEIIKKHFYD